MDCNVATAAANEEIYSKGMRNGLFGEISRGLLFEKGARERVWKDLEIKWLYCGNTVWNCFYAGERGRIEFEPVWGKEAIQMIPNANHFVSVTFYFGEHGCPMSVDGIGPLGKSKVICRVCHEGPLMEI